MEAKRAWHSLAVALLLTLPPGAGLAQTSQSEAGAEQDPFFQSQIPENFQARFVCHQGGQMIVEHGAVTSFAPSRIQDIMTFSLITRDGRNHLYYLGEGTTCGLTVAPPQN